MTPVTVRRLGYVAEQRSPGWIARETGIPRGALARLAEPGRIIPKQYETSLRNLYQRETYRRLRDVGFSFHQARRFSSYAPEAVGIKTLDMHLKIQDLTIGAIGKDRWERGVAEYAPIESDEWDEMYESIADAMRKSKKPWEELYYPKEEV